MPIIYFKLTAMAMVWGGAFVGVRYVSQFVGPFLGAALRFSMAAIVLGIVVRKIPRLSARQWGGILLLAASGIFGYNALFFVGMKIVESARGALIIGINPVFVTIASALLLGEVLTRRQFVGVAVSLLGGVLVITAGDGTALSLEIGLGEWALFGCCASWIAYSIIGKKVLAHLPALPVVFLATTAGALMLCLAAALFEPLSPAANMPLSAWLVLLLMGAFSTAAGNVWYYQGIAKIGVTRAANFINLVPLSAGLLGAIFLNEIPGWHLLAGGTMIIAGVAIVNRRG